MSLASLFVSTDIRSITLMGGACALGFLAAQPSPRVVRVAFAVIATLAITALLLQQHDASAEGQRADAEATTALFTRGVAQPSGVKGQGKGKGKGEVPFAALIHPEATRALASLAPLSRPGRKAAVRSVVSSTEAVVQAYHAVLLLPGARGARASACIDDLRDRTTVALDALQTLRMGTGSRGPASALASKADQDLRALFTRFRQIAGNKLKRPELMGGPEARDPTDDNRFVR